MHVAGFLPQLYGNGVQNDLGIGGEHIYMPRFNHRLKNLNYLRGFQMQFWNTGCQPYNLPRIANLSDGFGAGMKADIKRKYPAWVELHPFGETLPYRNNRITVDESQPDRYGVPKLKIDYEIGDNERKMADHIYDVLEEVGKNAGYRVGALQARRARQQRLGHPRARLLPHGRGPEALGAQQVEPDARSEEPLRRRRLRVHQRVGEEPDADDSGAVLARDRLSR